MQDTHFTNISNVLPALRLHWSNVMWPTPTPTKQQYNGRQDVIGHTEVYKLMLINILKLIIFS